MSLLRELLHEGGPRANAWIAITAASTLCISLLLLTFGLLCGKSVAASYSACCGAVAVLAGSIYAANKKWGQDAGETKAQ